MLEISMGALCKGAKVNEKTLINAAKGNKSLTVGQLEKIANFFNRSLLFFLNPNPINEKLIYSPQFRTINNQKPLHSRKLNALIERAEQQRKVYLNLLDTLDTPIAKSWYPNLALDINNTKETAGVVRKWLGIGDNLGFNELRALVENKGVMVFVSNSYSGKWQIDKKSSVRGFALYYDTLPIIVIKKSSKGAQAFTLMHELAHLLLHKDSMIDEESDFYSYKGKEKEANEFASNVLMSDKFLTSLDLDKVRNLDIKECDGYLQTFQKTWCVSGDAILYRLFREHKISLSRYQAYKYLKDEQQKQRELEEERKKLLPDYKSPPRVWRHREPANIFGRPFVATVLDALQNRHITLSKASSNLDNLKIHTLHKLERDFV